MKTYYVRQNPRLGTLADVREIVPDSAPQAPDEVIMTEAEYAAWLAAQPAPRRQETDTILLRLTPAEREALFNTRKANWQIDYLLTRAASTGAISESDADFPAAVGALDALGIIAAARWDDLLAP